MISTAKVQESIVTTLKDDAALVALVGEEIREEQWMGRGFDYPCVRVHITRISPIGLPGNCEDTSFVCDFDVSFRAISPSSKSTADGMAVALAALVGKKLSAEGAFVGRSAVKLGDVVGPTAEAENAWMSRAFLNCKLQEI